MTALNYGIKIVKAGKSITSSDLRDIIMSSKFTMLKQHSTSTGSATFNPKDTTKYVDFTHNLGYVPFFLAYMSCSSMEDGKERMIPGYTWASFPASGDESITGFSNAYANSSIVRCSLNLTNPYNQIKILYDQLYWEFWSGDAGIVVGNAGGGGKSTAYRFPAVPLTKNQSITEANMEIKNVFSGDGAANTKYTVYGIDEDNVGDVDIDKARTDAYDNREQSKVSGCFNFGTDCLDQVREIIARNNWASGNNMGFIIKENGSDSGSFIDGFDGTTAELTVVKSGTMVVTFRVIIFKDKIL